LLEAARRGERNLLVLPHTFELMPSALAAFLVAEGLPPDRPVTVFERLTHADEQVHNGTLGKLASCSHQFSDLSVVVLPL
jgi:cobalt-precorrin-7 (C5)-methyltransferase